MFESLWLGTLLVALFARVAAAAGELQVYAPYAPVLAPCPSQSLVRPATGLSKEEVAYIGQRNPVASNALRKWLNGTKAGFDVRTVPTLALANSGGGYRAMLVGAGVVQAMDDDDSNSTVSGLYQSLTYHGALSGGAWLLSSLIGNGEYSTVSKLQQQLWNPELANNSLYPLNVGTAVEAPAIVLDVIAKDNAGFTPTITDVWGRFLAYQLLKGEDGGVSKRLSDLTSSPKFMSARMPYPIISTLAKTGGIDGSVCDPPDNGTQIEITPYELGSWDQGVRAFTPTAFLGTKASNGVPDQGRCYRGYDNLGYILGTSSSKFQESCGSASISLIAGFLKPLLPATVFNSTVIAGVSALRRVLYAPYRNPFYQSSGSPLVANDPELYLLDGGEANQNNPIWPFLQPHRSVDVLFVNDNSADTDDNWPNGTEILHTYEQAQLQGLTKMPYIPPVADFVSKGLMTRASFFGCYAANQITIVFLPNQKWNYASNIPTSQFSYPANQTSAMIGNGNLIATQGDDAQWPTCLACGIMHKTAKTLPDDCRACLQKYCVSKQ